jgi:hypothetical protein
VDQHVAQGCDLSLRQVQLVTQFREIRFAASPMISMFRISAFW